MYVLYAHLPLGDCIRDKLPRTRDELTKEALQECRRPVPHLDTDCTHPGDLPWLRSDPLSGTPPSRTRWEKERTSLPPEPQKDHIIK